MNEPKGTFVDLGSGAGKAVLTAAMMCPNMERVVGIEILDQILYESTKLKERYEKMFKD